MVVRWRRYGWAMMHAAQATSVKTPGAKIASFFGKESLWRQGDVPRTLLCPAQEQEGLGREESEAEGADSLLPLRISNGPSTAAAKAAAANAGDNQSVGVGLPESINQTESIRLSHSEPVNQADSDRLNQTEQFSQHRIKQIESARVDRSDASNQSQSFCFGQSGSVSQSLAARAVKEHSSISFKPAEPVSQSCSRRINNTDSGNAKCQHGSVSAICSATRRRSVPISRGRSVGVKQSESGNQSRSA